jgi:hypothetical protein
LTLDRGRTETTKRSMNAASQTTFD